MQRIRYEVNPVSNPLLIIWDFIKRCQFEVGTCILLSGLVESMQVNIAEKGMNTDTFYIWKEAHKHKQVVLLEPVEKGKL